MNKLVRIFSALNSQSFGKKAARISLRVLGTIALLLTITCALAPTPAAAAPTGPKDGMFDCLGEFDWGCQMIGYFFEDSGLPDFSVDSRNRPSSTPQPTSIQTALRAMLGFFSNAVLVIASIKLLYELIQMVAETAHSGRIGGRDTNTLWAPIRLVVAIGLLVPLSSGLNSGQYIVIQMAKWGSGLGSQTWKAFTETFSENQTFAPAKTPAIRKVISEVLDIYMCKEAINYFVETSNANLANKVIPQEIDTLEGRKKLFKTNVSGGGGEALCGEISYKFTDRSGGALVDVTKRLTEANTRAMIEFEREIETEAKQLIRNFVGPGQFSALPTVAKLDSLVAKHQAILSKQITSLSPGVAQAAYKQITDAIKNAANYYGWTSAGAWFLSLTRAQGMIIGAGYTLPEAKSKISIASGNESADRAYQAYVSWMRDGSRNRPAANSTTLGLSTINTSGLTTIPLASGMRGYIEAPIKAGGDTVAGFTLSFGTDIQPEIEKLSNLIKNKTPRQAVTDVLDYIDELAGSYGVWTSGGPPSITGARNPNDYSNTAIPGIEIGKTANPFAELSSLGHRNLQLGLDLTGVAIIYASMGLGADLVRQGASSTVVSRPFGVPYGFASSFSFAMAFFFSFFATFVLIAGVFLAFLVPMLPFIHFFFGIITWVSTVIEGVLCLPFLALAHLTPKGEGFAGSKTKFGYVMLLQILVRPALTVIGLIAAALIFYVCVKFLGGMYHYVTTGVGIFTGPSGFVARIVFSVFHVALIYSCANISFKMISLVPKRALQWMGDGASEENHEDVGTISNVTNQISGNITDKFAGNVPQLAERLRARSS